MWKWHCVSRLLNGNKWKTENKALILPMRNTHLSPNITALAYTEHTSILRYLIRKEQSWKIHPKHWNFISRGKWNDAWALILFSVEIEIYCNIYYIFILQFYHIWFSHFSGVHYYWKLRIAGISVSPLLEQERNVAWVLGCSGHRPVIKPDNKVEGLSAVCLGLAS